MPTVLDAYDNRCAVTGLHMVNGGGETDIQGTHIWSVVDGRPDAGQNSIALSATAVWLFDRHLISLGDECRRLLGSHNKLHPSSYGCSRDPASACTCRLIHGSARAPTTLTYISAGERGQARPHSLQPRCFHSTGLSPRPFSNRSIA